MRFILALLVAGTIISATSPWSDTRAANPKTTVLTPDQFVTLVLERNLNLSGACEAAKAAAFRITPAGALDDPSLSYRIAPESVGVRGVNSGQMVEVAQPLPWFGTLAARTKLATANARAATMSAEAEKLNVIASAKSLFAEWYFIHEAIRLNTEQQQLVADLIRVAEARLAGGDGLQQDVLRAETELARLEDQNLSLSAARAVISSKISALTNTSMGSELPPPAPLTLPTLLPSMEALTTAALSQHPEIGRAEAMVAANRSRVRLAEKEFYPNFRLSTGYNSMMGREQMRWNVGISLNIPLNQGRRKSNLGAARANERESELQLIDRGAQIRAEVASTYAKADRALKSTTLLKDRLLPLARDTLNVSLSEYRSGAGDFLNVITAEQSSLTTEQSLYRARADLYRQLAALERVAGGPLDDSIGIQSGIVPHELSLVSEGNLP